ncbi:enoyl-CoA hydratase/isomerase family protein, partial [bacterium]|nr:enoyl-CoA hydratase/isomerase family protein [bacterium]
MEKVLIEEHKHYTHVKLHRPEVRNAFHPEMIAELTKTFKSLAKNKDLRAVVLSGEGASFCAGADLEWMKSMAKYN